ncbi:MAG: MATE family efflux transporter [Acutalibacteraceae bacterium]
MPVFIALFLQAMYSAVDLMVVGKFGSSSGVSAVGTGGGIIFLATAVVNGLSVGATVLIGHKIGEGNPEEAGKVIGSAVIVFSATGALLTAVMLGLANPIARIMQAPDEAFNQTVQYVSVCACGIIFTTGYNIIGGIFRGLGNSRLPMFFAVIACICNILGDLLFVAVLKLDVVGAALATILAQAVSVVLSVVIISRIPLPFCFKKSYISLKSGYCRQILRIGMPVALQDTLVEFSFLAVNAFINGIGLDQSAGYGIANRVIAFIMLVPSAVMTGVTAFVAQNIGAGNKQRAKRVMFTAVKAGTVGGVILFAVGFFFGGQVASLFSNDEAAIAQASYFLKGFAPDCILTCTLFSFIGYFSGCKNTKAVMIQGVTSSFLIRLPLAYLFSSAPNPQMWKIATATPISTIYGIAFCVIYWFIRKRNEKIKQEAHT